MGSDSHVGRAWPAELRLLEYGQRLALRARNVAAAPACGQPATAAHLYERVRQGGAAAAGHTRWGLEAGARADLLVLDAHAPGLSGVPPGHLLDALVFATDAPTFARVMVAGHWIAHDREREVERRDNYADALNRLWHDDAP